MDNVKGVKDFAQLVRNLMLKWSLMEHLYDLLELGNGKGIKLGNKISFLGEYQRLLYRGLVLDISYLLLDGENKEDKISRMRRELDLLKEELREEIDIQKVFSLSSFRVSCEKMLCEIKNIQSCEEYKEAIDFIKVVRNKVVAHSETFELPERPRIQEELKLIIENVRRCYEIRVNFNISKGKQKELPFINVASKCDQAKIIEAFMLQNEIEKLKIENFDDNESSERVSFSGDFSNLKFWNEKIEPSVFGVGEIANQVRNNDIDK